MASSFASLYRIHSLIYLAPASTRSVDDPGKQATAARAFLGHDMVTLSYGARVLDGGRDVPAVADNITEIFHCQENGCPGAV